MGVEGAVAVVGEPIVVMDDPEETGPPVNEFLIGGAPVGDAPLIESYTP